MTAPEIQQQIEATREHLGQTVDELAARADVKARARDKATEVKRKAQGRAADVAGRLRQSQLVRRRWPLAVAAVAAGAAAACAAVAWRRKRSAR